MLKRGRCWTCVCLPTLTSTGPVCGVGLLLSTASYENLSTYASPEYLNTLQTYAAEAGASKSAICLQQNS
jgi:hypothetical protein